MQKIDWKILYLKYKKFLPYLAFVVLIAILGLCTRTPQTQNIVETADMSEVGAKGKITIGVRNCSKIQVAEYVVRKIVTHNDQYKFFGFTLSERNFAVPLDIAFTASIDLSEFSESNINTTGDNITLTLPDPIFEIEYCKPDYSEIFPDNFMNDYKAGEFDNLIAQGRASIIANFINNEKLLDEAKIYAANALTPIIMQMGYKKDNIIVRFRKDFKFNDLNQMIKL